MISYFFQFFVTGDYFDHSHDYFAHRHEVTGFSNASDEDSELFASIISIICELVINSQVKQLADFCRNLPPACQWHGCRFSSMNKDVQKLNLTTHAMAYFMVPGPYGLLFLYHLCKNIYIKVVMTVESQIIVERFSTTT